jgi:hypothetical protein
MTNINRVCIQFVFLFKQTEENRIPEEDDDEKGLVIDDTNVEDSGRLSTESSTDLADGDSLSKLSNEEDVEKDGKRRCSK